MSKHTPGPWIGKNEHGKYNSEHTWRADDKNKSSSETAPIWAGGKVIALVVHSSDRFSLESHPSIDANARLIAAAPDLLGSAQRLARRGFFTPVSCADEATLADMDSMRAAIAKATEAA